MKKVPKKRYELGSWNSAQQNKTTSPAPQAPDKTMCTSDRLSTGTDVREKNQGYICEKSRASLSAPPSMRLLIAGGGGFLSYYPVRDMLH